MLLPAALLTALTLAALAWRNARGGAPAPMDAASAAEDGPAEPLLTARPGGASGPVGTLLEQGVGVLKDAIGGNAGTVAAGLAATGVAAKLVEAAGGSEMEVAATKVNLTAAAPILVKQGVAAVLDAAGVGNQAVKETAGETVAAALFAPALLPVYAQLKLGQALVAALNPSEPEPFKPPVGELLSRGEASALGSQPYVIAQMLLQRRRALLMSQLVPGTHAVEVQVSTDEWDGPAKWAVMVDGKIVTTELVAVAWHSRGERQKHRVRVSLNGAKTIGVVFFNPAYSPSEGYRKLWVDGLFIDGTRYEPAGDGAVYFREELPQLPGQSEMIHRGALVWPLKPEHQVVNAPVRSGFTAAERSLAEASTKFFTV